MTLEVATVIYLRERIEALQKQKALLTTKAAIDGIDAAIKELEACAQKVSQPARRWEA